MTVYDQVALFITAFTVIVISLFCLVDWAMEQIEAQGSRNRTWRAIEIRSAMERHPSSQVDVFDQDAEG
jgi:hypothetical protein